MVTDEIIELLYIGYKGLIHNSNLICNGDSYREKSLVCYRNNPKFHHYVKLVYESCKHKDRETICNEVINEPKYDTHKRMIT